jgi:hypothetical protein
MPEAAKSNYKSCDAIKDANHAGEYYKTELEEGRAASSLRMKTVPQTAAGKQR